MRIVTTLLIASSVLASSLMAAPRQTLTGLQANWNDLETWSRLDESSRANELGLGLHPAGGAVIAFLGRLPVRSPRTPPTEIRMHVAPTYMANPNILRVKVLTFLADAGTDRRATFDLSGGLLTDDSSPGGIITNGIASMPAADFVRLTQSRTLTAKILSFDVVFSPSQLRAMDAFARRLYLGRSDAR